MKYTFYDLSNAKLSELADAVRQEQERRFMLRIDWFPKIEGVFGVDAIKAYREKYHVNLTQAMWIRNHYRQEVGHGR